VPGTLAVVDLGSNSFRLEIGRVEGDQIYRLDTWRETLRFGAGLDSKGRITPAAARLARACLARFRERLAGVHPSAVRAVATNAFRVARNAAQFLPQAERALGFPIDVIPGVEEARLIYLGAAHELSPSPRSRLVIDIGGGSTEFIIGRNFEPERLESLTIGCVDMTQRFFADGEITAAVLRTGETVARAEIEAIAHDFGPQHWQDAYASSGTASALEEILEQNGFSDGGITPGGLARLRRRLIAAGSVDKLRLNALKSDRVPVLAGGLVIMSAAMAELKVERIDAVGGALRLGVLHDLLGRTTARDARETTVQRFVERYGVEATHAEHVRDLASRLFRQCVPDADADARQLLGWAALLHEIGMSVSHLGFHKHAAYILQHADMPGFSAREQQRLAWLVLGCRGGLSKIRGALDDPLFRAQVLALRLAVIIHHARAMVASPRIALQSGPPIRFSVSPRWLKAHPLSAHLLDKERLEWLAAGFAWKRPAA
jgi:exopolyphosphatase/guanosine-5'-triphosphate,3'-diphosphate pyrophosphatase